MSIACGHCHHRHETIAQVRACSLGNARTATAVMDRPAASAQPLASEKQRNFITKLMQERGFDSTAIENVLKGCTMGQASDKIRILLDTPKATQTVVAAKVVAPKVPAGRYAVVIDGVTKFFKVDTPTEGRWAGRTFVKIQASDELHAVRGDTARQVLELIAKDPEAASKLYGREIGACGVCGRTLTDEESRANGIGPICAEKAVW